MGHSLHIRGSGGGGLDTIPMSMGLAEKERKKGGGGNESDEESSVVRNLTTVNCGSISCIPIGEHQLIYYTLLYPIICVSGFCSARSEKFKRNYFSHAL
jgi:hypothetical protein